MRYFTRPAAMISMLLTAACGGGDDGGTTPAATAASITIASSNTGSFASLTETRAVSATVRDASSNAIPNAPVTWTTSNQAVASVSGTGSTATITSVSNGTAVITASSGAVSATVNVDVTQKFVSLSMTPAASTSGIGATVNLIAVARDARNAAISSASGITYVTSDRTKALVDNTGVVTTIAPGAATITASLTRDGVTATSTAAVTVTAPVAGGSLAATVNASSANTFTPNSVTVAVGGTVTWTFALDHNVLFSGAGAPQDIPATASGSVARVFGTAGTFPYTCSLHAGMNGTVLVQSPSIFAQMNGTNERPTANNSTANGAALFTRSGNNVSYTVSYQGIASAPTGLHIHAPGNNTQAVGIIVDLLTTPLPNTSGVLTGTFTASGIRSIAGAPPISLDSLFVLLTNGNAYVNVHSTTFPAGEIRGQTGQP